MDGERKIQLHHTALPLTGRGALLRDGVFIYGLMAHWVKAATRRVGLAYILDRNGE